MTMTTATAATLRSDDDDGDGGGGGLFKVLLHVSVIQALYANIGRCKLKHFIFDFEFIWKFPA